jgi:hypothetical protein
MDVQIADSEEPYYIYKAFSPETQHWETVGNIGIFSSAFVAMGAFVPAVMKKRVYTFNPTNNGNGAAPVEVAAAEGAEAAPAIEAPRCTEPEREKIVELFSTIADGGANLAFPWVIYRLTQLGNEIHHVHIFALLQAMPREKIRQVFMGNSDFKKGKILEGINEGMQRELGRGKVNPFIPSFAASMQKEEALTRQLIQAGDWLALVQYLFEIPAARRE